MLSTHLTVSATILHFLLASIPPCSLDAPPISLAIFLRFPGLYLPLKYWHCVKFHIHYFIYQFKLPSICRKHQISTSQVWPYLLSYTHTHILLLDSFTSQIHNIQKQIKISPQFYFSWVISQYILPSFSELVNPERSPPGFLILLHFLYINNH